MDITAIRQKLYEYIKVADDEKVEAIYTIIKDDVGAHYEWWNDEELIKELDRRSAALSNGEDAGFTLEESKAHLIATFKKNG